MPKLAYGGNLTVVSHLKIIQQLEPCRGGRCNFKVDDEDVLDRH